jgi:hypothetical protein
MKTKIAVDEKIPENIVKQIKDIISLPINGQNIGIPIYDQVHQANVCVICDRFITGTAEIKWIKNNTLLQHKSRLSIPGLKKELQQCYQVSDPELHDMLLSPRARFKNSAEYLCCHQCERALQNDRLNKNPPKYAISNNFAIGASPDQLSNMLSDVTSPLLSPIRPFAYIMSYSGGAHKTITGTFTFFNQSVEKNIGALNFHSNISRNSNVYVLLSGSFTPNQRNIIKSRCSIYVRNFTSIFSWLRENNPIFSNMMPVDQCPIPIILEDDTGTVEESEYPNVENHVDIPYWFPNNGNPTCSILFFILRLI